MKKSLLICLLIAPLVFMGQSFEEGKTIFKNNCASCHQMDKKMVGPKLMNVVEKQGADWVYKWVKNNKELRASGDKHANEIYQEYGGAAMPVYDYLGDEKLKSVVEYLSQWKEKSVPTKKEQPKQTSNPDPKSEYSFPTWFKVITGVITIFIVIVFYLLFDVIKTLAKQKNDAEDE